MQSPGKNATLQDGPQSPEVKGSQSATSTQSNATGTSQSDSGGDDSAKENKENSADENQQTPKAKKGWWVSKLDVWKVCFSVTSNKQWEVIALE